MQPETLDPQAVAMSKAIRQTESGGNFKAKGKSGEYGAYQYTEPTWQKLSSKYGINTRLQDATPEQQNEVAYRQVKEWKDKGHNPGQIASMWNAGEGEPDAYTGKFSNGHPSTGVNKFGAHFDVPAYAKSVASAYQKLKGGGEVQADPANPSSTANTTPLQTPPPQATQAAPEQPAPAQTSQPLNKPLEVATGAFKGLIGGVKSIADMGQEFANQTAGRAANLLTGKGNVPTEGGLINTPGVQQANQNLEQNLKSENSYQTAGKIGEGIAEIAAPGLLGKKAIDAATLPGKILEAISPKMTARETAAAIASRGGKKTGLLRTITANVDPELQKIAKTVQEHVPNFNPSGTATENVNAVHNRVYQMADELKQRIAQDGRDIIFPYKELAAKMSAVEKPIAIKSDKVLANQFELAKQSALKIVKNSGGKISNLLDARKEFDQLVSKQFPTLYDRANAPMRSAITGIRNAMNDFIEDKMPDVGYKESLKAQSQLLRAVDNLSEKAAEEVGTTGLNRLADKHPLITGVLKTAKKVATGAAITGLGFEGAKTITGD